MASAMNQGGTHMLSISQEQPMEVVDITNPGRYSRLGKYFIGQTGELTFGNRYNAWGGLINPVNSKVNLYFDIFTITNFSSHNFTAEILLNALLAKARTSSLVTPANQAIVPHPKPKAILQYADYLTEAPLGGINIFDRIVPENSTLVSDSHKGSIIIGPGRSFSILLKSPGTELIKGTIVLTWWEEEI
jgi:hypothetical protein